MSTCHWLRRALFLPLCILAHPAALGAQVETPAPCPERVNPGVIGYPMNIIDYDDGDDRGDFLVLQLWDPNALIYGPRPSVTYRTLPDIPWDVNDNKKEWRYAAIDADCFWLTVYPQTWWVVQERFKYGLIQMAGENDSACAEGGETDTRLADYSAETYDPYDPTLSLDNGDCAPGEPPGGEGGTGANPVCGGSEQLVYDYICIDIWDQATERWVELWCGIAAICA